MMFLMFGTPNTAILSVQFRVFPVIGQYPVSVGPVTCPGLFSVLFPVIQVILPLVLFEFCLALLRPFPFFFFLQQPLLF